ncbi:hypothetical protein DV515_00014293 [Chloebia gouldiae]|uniref:Follistatin-related protein 1 n=1 Tax=Chloebia gouldiae TaxID=44316 RepID=A0A3L8RZR3_CHLGU|nr:hypothetical protein DV515_00014293 [Chloebia gouldiae]
MTRGDKLAAPSCPPVNMGSGLPGTLQEDTAAERAVPSGETLGFYKCKDGLFNIKVAAAIFTHRTPASEALQKANMTRSKEEPRSKSKICANVFCGAGRECAVTEKGEPTCLCIEKGGAESTERCNGAKQVQVQRPEAQKHLWAGMAMAHGAAVAGLWSIFMLNTDFSAGVCFQNDPCHAGGDGNWDKKCKPHKRPVCGSNGKTYLNHCELHRDACLTGSKIQVDYDGHCKEKKSENPAASPELIHLLRFFLCWDVSGTQHRQDAMKPNLPPGTQNCAGLFSLTLVFPSTALSPITVVCYQSDRDELRRRVIQWLEAEIIPDGWFSKGSNYSEVLDKYFKASRASFDDGDSRLDSTEFLKFVEQNETAINITTYMDQETNKLLRGLCIDALIELSDENADWKLSFNEFLKCLSPSFNPPEKKCALEDETYEDGAETQVECNRCVCACGNWVCTAMTCEGLYALQKITVLGNQALARALFQSCVGPARRTLVQIYRRNEKVPVQRHRPDQDMTEEEMARYVQELQKHQVSMKLRRSAVCLHQASPCHMSSFCFCHETAEKTKRMNTKEM